MFEFSERAFKQLALQIAVRQALDAVAETTAPETDCTGLLLYKHGTGPQTRKGW